MERFIKIGKELVPVSEEVYKECYIRASRKKYLENDIKVGRIDVDVENETVTFVDSKEDSLQRLMEQGADFTEDKRIEDIVCDKAMLVILQAAMTELDHEEKELIHALYYKNLTLREYAEQKNVSHTAIKNRRNKILDKFKNLFHK